MEKAHAAIEDTITITGSMKEIAQTIAKAKLHQSSHVFKKT